MDLKQYTTEPLAKIFRFLADKEKQPINSEPKIEDYRYISIDFADGISHSYLLTFNNFNQMSISQVLIKTTDFRREELLKSFPNYFPFQNLYNTKQYLLI